MKPLTKTRRSTRPSRPLISLLTRAMRTAIRRPTATSIATLKAVKMTLIQIEASVAGSFSASV